MREIKQAFRAVNVADAQPMTGTEVSVVGSWETLLVEVKSNS